MSDLPRRRARTPLLLRRRRARTPPSRLAAILEKLDDDDCAIIATLEAAAEFVSGATPRELLWKLWTMLAQQFPSHALGELLDSPIVPQELPP